MEDFEENETLYTDIVMQIFSVFINTNSNQDLEDLSEIITSSVTDPNIAGPGILAGLLYASVVHMSLLLGTLSKTLGKERTEVLKNYALSYSQYRSELAKMPQLRPDFVNYLMIRYLEQKDNE